MYTESIEDHYEFIDGELVKRIRPEIIMDGDCLRTSKQIAELALVSLEKILSEKAK